MARTPVTWDVEDNALWENSGKKIAFRNLAVSIPDLLCGFALWIYWGMIAKFVQRLHFADNQLFNFLGSDGQPLSADAYRGLLFTLPAVAGLAGATLRIPHSFMIALCGGRNVKFLTTLMLILPAIGSGIALQNPNTSFFTLVLLAALSGVGGGAFSSSMSNISAFFPKRMQGLALGLNAGLGNLGVSVMQFLLPWVITFGLFGTLGGDAYNVVEVGNESALWVQNAGLVWVPILGFLVVATWLVMNNLPQQQADNTGKSFLRFFWLSMLGFGGVAAGVSLMMMDWGAFPELLKDLVVLLVSIGVTLGLMRYFTLRDAREGLVKQFAIFRSKHNWVMTYLYTMTFGSFIGYANAFPKLIDDVFGVIRVDEHGARLAESISNTGAPHSSTYIWIGAGVGAAIRPIGGWLSDKWGGARVTQWATWVMILATIASGWCVAQASQSVTPEEWFMPFLALFIVLFAATGVGNGSTFRMVPYIFSKEQAGPVLGWISAIAAYGAFLIPKIFATQIKAGTPEYALYGIALYYVSCLGLNWWFYARKGAEVPC